MLAHTKLFNGYPVTLTTGHFLSFHSRVAVQQISCTNSYSTEMKTDGYH